VKEGGERKNVNSGVGRVMGREWGRKKKGKAPRGKRKKGPFSSNLNPQFFSLNLKDLKDCK